MRNLAACYHKGVKNSLSFLRYHNGSSIPESRQYQKHVFKPSSVVFCPKSNDLLTPNEY